MNNNLKTIFCFLGLGLILTSTSTGQKPLKVFEIWDFNIGDEIHTSTKTENVCSSSPAPYEYFKKKVIGKYYNTFGDTLYLEFKIEYTHIKWVTPTELKNVTETIYNTQPITHLDSFQFVAFVGIDTTSTGSYLNFKQFLDFSKNYRVVNEIDYYNGFEGRFNYTYIEGLGGWYGQDVVSPTVVTNQLHYYKKGSEEWGKKVTVGLEDHHSNVGKTSTFPNPTTGKFTIDGFEGQIIRMEVMDLNGRLISTEENAGFKRIFDWSHLNPKIYLINVYGVKEFTQFKLVLVE